MKFVGKLLALVAVMLPLAVATGYGQETGLPSSMVKMKSGECRFTVLGPDGIKPLEGVRVSIVPVDGSAGDVSTVTDTGGVCGFNIDQGRYVISLNDRQIALLQTSPTETITDYRFVVPSESMIMETHAAAETIAEVTGAGETAAEAGPLAETVAADTAAAEVTAVDMVAAETATTATTATSTTTGEEGLGVITTFLNKKVAIGILVVGGLAGGAVAIADDDDDDPPRAGAPTVPAITTAAPSRSGRDGDDTTPEITPKPPPKPVTPPVTSP